MEYLEFLEKARPYLEIYDRTKGSHYDQFKSLKKDAILNPDSNFVLTSGHWVCGGRSGGNCWGGVSNYPVESSQEEPFNDLDSLLEDLCPDISFMKYKSLLNECVAYDEYSDGGDYYGNYYEQRFKICSVRTLYDYLKERNLI